MKPFFVFFSLLFCSFLSYAQSTEISKNYVLYTFHIAKYVDWKEQTDVFTIAVIGNTHLSSMMAASYKNKKLKNAPIQVVSYTSFQEIQDCQILFLPKNQKQYLGEILKKFANKPVLIITEFENAGNMGACVNFITDEDNQVKFELNRKAIKQAGFKLNNSLLALAILIN